jgi:7-cyano-7-deazaguanine synthase
MSKPKSQSTICVLVSGGLDSCVLLAEMARTHQKVFPVFIRQGLQWERAELFWLRKFLRRLNCRNIAPLHVIALPMGDVYGNHWSQTGKKVPGARSPDAAVYLPGRNLLLLSKTAVFCALRDIPHIALAPLNHNPFADASPGFFQDFQRLATDALGKAIRVSVPFRNLSKRHVIKRGKHLPLHLTFSCIAPRKRLHCGNCNKCAERKNAFRESGIRDATQYARL